MNRKQGESVAAKKMLTIHDNRIIKRGNRED